MTSRSTRNKMRAQVEKAMGNVDRATEHLARLDAIGEGRSNYINSFMPKMVFMLEEVKKTLGSFREGL